MKIWIASYNLNQNFLREWENEIQNFLEHIFIKKTVKFNSVNTSISFYEYDYFKKVNSDITIYSCDEYLNYIDGYLIHNEKRFSNFDCLSNNFSNKDALIKFFKKTRGEFSYIKVSSNEILIATDIYSSRQIYYYRLNNIFVASNDLRALILCPIINLEISYDKCYLTLTSDYALGENEIDSNKTFFCNIFKIPSYTALILSDNILQLAQYINFQTDIINSLFMKNIGNSDNFNHVLNNAVEERVQNNKVAIMLSGGVDSSTILGSLKQLGKLDQVLAVNLGFEDEELSLSQDRNIVTNLIKDFGVRGGILKGYNLLRFYNPLTHNDIFDYIDGPCPLANKLASEAINYYSLDFKADLLLTGEQGDAVLGEDNITMIYDSLIKNGYIREAFNTIKKYNYNKTFTEKFNNYLRYIFFNLFSYTRNNFYRSTYWNHTNIDEMPSYFSNQINCLENDLKRNNSFLSKEFTFELVWHKYVFDYFFPKAAYFNRLNLTVPNSHPFIDRRILEFTFSNPSHIHCDYSKYRPNENYLRAKFLAREAYTGVLPDYARLKEIKTSYAGMARKMLHNSTKDLLELFFDSTHIWIEELNIVDINKFKKHLQAVLIRAEDPNYNLGVSYQYLRVLIQLEIWLKCMNSPAAHLKNLIKVKPPRALTDMEWIRC